MDNIFQGLKQLHDNKFEHRDIKLENILVNDNDQFKICDYGFTKQMKNLNP